MEGTPKLVLGFELVRVSSSVRVRIRVKVSVLVVLVNFVVSAGTINTFKNRLDKFWSDQDILYDYKADLHGIGNRSVVY